MLVSRFSQTIYTVPPSQDLSAAVVIDSDADSDMDDNLGFESQTNIQVVQPRAEHFINHISFQSTPTPSPYQGPSNRMTGRSVGSRGYPPIAPATSYSYYNMSTTPDKRGARSDGKGSAQNALHSGGGTGSRWSRHEQVPGPLYLHSPGLSPIPNKVQLGVDTPDLASRLLYPTQVVGYVGDGNAVSHGGKSNDSTGPASSEARHDRALAMSTAPRSRAQSTQSEVSLQSLPEDEEEDSDQSPAHKQAHDERIAEDFIDSHPQTHALNSGSYDDRDVQRAEANAANGTDAVTGHTEDEDDFKLVSILECDRSTAEVPSARPMAPGLPASPQVSRAVGTQDGSLYNMHVFDDEPSQPDDVPHLGAHSPPRLRDFHRHASKGTMLASRVDLDAQRELSDASLVSLSVLRGGDTPQSARRPTRHGPSTVSTAATPANLIAAGIGNSATRSGSHAPTHVGQAYSIALDANGSPMLVPLLPVPGGSGHTPIGFTPAVSNLYAHDAVYDVGYGSFLGHLTRTHVDHQTSLTPGSTKTPVSVAAKSVGWSGPVRFSHAGINISSTLGKQSPSSVDFDSMGSDNPHRDIRDAQPRLREPNFLQRTSQGYARSSGYWKDRLSRRRLGSVMKSPLVQYQLLDRD